MRGRHKICFEKPIAVARYVKYSQERVVLFYAVIYSWSATGREEHSSSWVLRSLYFRNIWDFMLFKAIIPGLGQAGVGQIEDNNLFNVVTDQGWKCEQLIPLVSIDSQCNVMGLINFIFKYLRIMFYELGPLWSWTSNISTFH